MAAAAPPTLQAPPSFWWNTICGVAVGSPTVLLAQEKGYDTNATFGYSRSYGSRPRAAVVNDSPPAATEPVACVYNKILSQAAAALSTKGDSVDRNNVVVMGSHDFTVDSGLAGRRPPRSAVR